MSRVLTFGLLIGLLVLPGVGWADATVEVGHNRLTPADVTIDASETVHFHNVDAMPGGHTIVADDDSFASPPLEKDASWSHRFEKPGSYSYHIKEHPEATGTITVR